MQAAPMEVELPKIRGYQEDILRKALKRNVIAFLPTGAGKTLIAARLIREKIAEIDPAKEDRKWTVFLTPTVILVHQQAAAIQREVPEDRVVKGFYGELNVDVWNKAKWLEETNKVHILVMTPQIFINMMRHSYWSISQCNLLILDEIHQATGDSPYSRIFKEYYHNDAYPIKPHVFGMTASPVFNVQDNEHAVREAITELEQKTDCILVTAHDRSDLAKYVARPEEKIVYYDNSEFKSQIDVLFQSIPHEKGQKTLLSALSLAAEVGLEAAYRYVKNKRFKQETFEEQEKLKKFLCIADEHRHDLDISYKFNHVCDLIRELRARHGDEFCGIIFVERRATCRYLCKLLGDVDLGEGIQLGFFHGQAKTTCPAEDRPSVEDIQKKFKSKQINLLIATKAVEEGVDVQACKFVVQYDKMQTTKSYIQSRGRARKLDSDFILFVETHDVAYQKKIQQHHNAENIMIGQTAREVDDLAMELDSTAAVDFKDDEPPYIVPSTGATANLLSSVQLVNQYAQTIPTDGYTSNKLQWDEVDLGGTCQATVETPDGFSATGLVHENKKSAKRSAALAMVRQLHEKGLLNDNLLPNVEREETGGENLDEVEAALVVDMIIPEKLQTKLTIGQLYIFSEISDFPGRAIFGLIFPTEMSDIPTTFKYGNKEFHVEHHGPYSGDLEPIKQFNMKLYKFLFDWPEIPKWQDGVKNILILPCSVADDELFIDQHVMSEFIKEPNPEENLLEVINSGKYDLRTMTGYLCRAKHTKDEQIFIIEKFSTEPITKVWDQGTEKYVYNYFTDKYGLELDPNQLVVYGRVISMRSLLATENIYKEFWVESAPRHLHHMPPQICRVFFQKFDWLLQYKFIPSFIHQIERHLVEKKFVGEFRANFAESRLAEETSLPLLKQAMTAPVMQEKPDYERLEILGDTVIKLLVATGLFYKKPHFHEGQLTTLLGNRVSNKALREAFVNANLHHYIQNVPFQHKNKAPNHRWTIPGIDVTPVKRTFPAKVIADCTEAMIGASYILEQLGTNPDSMDDNDYGNFTELSSKEVVSLRSALTMMMKFNVAADISSAIESILAGNYTAVNEQNKLALNENQLALVTALEKDLGYVFVTKRLALEAITHPSYRVDYSGSYQRLEFLGDAVLDFFNLRYLYFKNRDANPGLLTEYKHASVNNQAFSYVCVKNKLHKHMRVVNGDLVRAIREFEEACQNSPSVHDIDTPAPKPLGDIFEAIAGAIFVDQRFRYEKVWDVYKKFLLPFWTNEITENKRGTPISHLYNWISQYTKQNNGCEKIKLSAEEAGKNKPAKCTLLIHGKEILSAEGGSKHTAKWRVGKKALAMSHDLHNPFDEKFCTCKKDQPATENNVMQTD
jgi:endoribonuclease Dicer